MATASLLPLMSEIGGALNSSTTTITPATEVPLTTTTTTTVALFGITSQSLRTCVMVNAVSLVAFCVAFNILARCRCCLPLLLPKYSAGQNRPLFPLTFLGWVCKEEADNANVDRFVVLRFCQLGVKFSVVGYLCCILLVTLHEGIHKDGGGLTFLLSISSLAEAYTDSATFVWILIGAYVFAGCLMQLLLAEWRAFVRCRRAHFVRSGIGHATETCVPSDDREREKIDARAQARRSVLVENIPPEYQTKEDVQHFFEERLGERSVHSCILLKDGTQAYIKDSISWCYCCTCCLRRRVGESLAKAGDATRRGLDKAVSELHTPIRPLDISPPAQGEIVSSTLWDIYQGVRNFFASMVRLGQYAIAGSGGRSTAIVTFREAVNCAKASQLLLERADATHFTRSWQVRAAPEPRDVVWRNIRRPLDQNRLRAVIVCFLLTCGGILWATPITLVRDFTQVESLRERFPSFMGFLILKAPSLIFCITAYLPALSLMGLQALLPYLFEILARCYEGTKSESEIEQKILGRCFAYGLASLYVNVCVGSVYELLSKILEHPLNLLDVLSNKILPGVSVYFITYVLTQIGFSLPLWLLLRPCTPLFGRDQYCRFGYQLANLSLVLVLGLTYSFIAPAILPACAFYFGFAHILYRFLFEFVYADRFDSGGAMWYSLFRCVMFGIFIGTLAIVAVAWECSSSSAIERFFAIPLPIVVVLFYCYCWRRIGNDSLKMDLDLAIEIDKKYGEKFPGGLSHSDKSAYVDPITSSEVSLVDLA